MSNGVRLTFQFTDKVTVRTASINGKWVMFLGDHPIEPLEQSFHFQNPYVTDVHFDDQDGLPKLVITPSGVGLNFYPVVAEGGKVLLADVLKPPPPLPQTPAPSAPGSHNRRCAGDTSVFTRRHAGGAGHAAWPAFACRCPGCRARRGRRRRAQP